MGWFGEIGGGMGDKVLTTKRANGNAKGVNVEDKTVFPRGAPDGQQGGLHSVPGQRKGDEEYVERSRPVSFHHEM